MKNIITKTFYGFVSISILATSCDATRRASNRDKGVAVGAVGGAVIGGIIGNNVGNKNNTAIGAIIGAAVGGVAGGIIGNKMDKQAEKIKFCNKHFVGSVYYLILLYLKRSKNFQEKRCWKLAA